MTITITITGDTAASVAITSLVRLDTGDDVAGLTLPDAMTDAGGGVWTYEFTEPAEDLAYRYEALITWPDATTTEETGTVGLTTSTPTTYGTREGIEGIYGTTDVSAYADVNDNQDADDIAAQIDRARRAMYNRINLALAKAGLTAPATSDNFSQFDILADVENELAGVWLYFKRGKNDNDPNGPAQMQWHWDNAMSVLDQAIGVDVGDDPDIVGAGEFQFVPIRRTTPTDENSE